MPTLRNYRLTFDDAEFEGIEVAMGRLTIDELFDYDDILRLPRTTKDESRAYWDALRAFVGKHMVSWNVEDNDGKTLPTGDVADLRLLEKIRDGWLEGLNGGRAPLDRPAQEADLADLMQQPDPSPPSPNADGNEPDSSPTP